MNVKMPEFACEAVAGEDQSADHVSAMVARAIQCYVKSKGSGGSGWSYPRFRQADEPGRDTVEVRVSIDDDLWRSLEAEADEQGVAVERMVVHAAFWFAAEIDAGRVTERIVEGLDEATGEETRA